MELEGGKLIMDKIMEAQEILSISEKIYQIQEETNSKAIFKDKVFVIGTETDRNAISIERNFEKKDSSYYFETPELNGVILKRENGNYCVKTAVKYSTPIHKNWWFAKIRIEKNFNGNIQIMGQWGGSWQDYDYKDEDFIKNPNKELPYALMSMKLYLKDIYNKLSNDKLDSDSYDPKWVKQLKRYN